MIALILWVLFGGAVGTVARWLYPTYSVPPSVLSALAVGIIGSVFGGAVWALISASRYHPGGFVLSVVGAVAFLYAYERYIRSL